MSQGSTNNGTLKCPRFADRGVQVDIGHNNPAETMDRFPKNVVTLGHNNDMLAMMRNEKSAMRSSTYTSHRHFKQVGLVRVQVEILSLSQQLQAQGASEDQCETEPEDSDYAQELDTEASDRNAAENEVDELQSIHVGENYTNTTRRSRKRQEDGEDEPDGNKRTRRNPPESRQTAHLRRLACPYQAHDRNQVCLRPARSNPKGGCAGISRLKLVSRHFASKKPWSRVTDLFQATFKKTACVIFPMPALLEILRYHEWCLRASGSGSFLRYDGQAMERTIYEPRAGAGIRASLP